MSDDFTSPKPFVVNIPDEEVERMKRLVADTRLPDESPLADASWDYGVDITWLKKHKDAWQHDFDWKSVEREMNAFDHFTVVIESVTVHFVHQRSQRPDATAIMLLHGWPGTFYEFTQMIELLTNPPADQPAFHVVIPSLPGFGFSSAPPRKGWTMEDNARILDQLMTGVLGYPAYMVEGGDFGGFICLFLGSDTYPACKLLNVTESPVPPPPRVWLTLPFFLLPTSWRKWLYSWIYTEDELGDFARNGTYFKSGLGYYIQQMTRPFTIGYALYDSPIGLLAWIGEKYREYSDPEVDTTHLILTTVSLYYLTRTFATSTLPYHENSEFFSGKRDIIMTKPYGSSRFSHDILHVPLSWVKAKHRKLVFYRRHERGGHFPGFEAPALLAQDLRDMVSANSALFM